MLLDSSILLMVRTSVHCIRLNNTAALLMVWIICVFGSRLWLRLPLDYTFWRGDLLFKKLTLARFRIELFDSKLMILFNSTTQPVCLMCENEQADFHENDTEISFWIKFRSTLKRSPSLDFKFLIFRPGYSHFKSIW